MKIFINTLIFVGVAVVMTAALMAGLDKEAARQDAVRDYNCKHYAYAINKHAGKEVCPPTPQG